LLGQGSSAHVYLGEHKYRHTFVALKIPRKEAFAGLIPRGSPSPDTNRRKKRARNESHMLSHLTHPHVIRMHEYGIQENLPFLVMDWAKKGTLHNLFSSSFPVINVAAYVKQIASALQYLHMLHITHRDIKPTNILIKQDGSALLADFELAIDYRNSQSTAGTPTYAAPEQKQGCPCPASDQYALGVLVYQWLCGELPFHPSPTETVAQHSNISQPPLRDKVPTLPTAIEQVVLTTLAKDPNSRFANIQTFAKAFEQACQLSTYRTPAIPTPQSTGTGQT